MGIKDANHSATEVVEDFLTKDFRITFSPSRRKTVKKVFVTVNGHLSVQYVSKLANSIYSILTLYDQVEVRVNELDQFDMAAVQLLYYLGGNNKITLEVDVPLEIRPLLSFAGMSEVFDRNPLENRLNH